MEGRKNRPSLPPNYVTLAQLQDRWLKQQSQTNQPEPQQPEPQQPEPQQPEPQQPAPPQSHRRQWRHKVVVPPRNGTASSSHPQKQYVVKNRNDSETHRAAIEVASDARRQSEAGAVIGDKTADLDGKVSKSKKRNNWKTKWKTKKEERKASGKGSATSVAAAAQGNEEAEKAAMLKEEKNGGSITTEKVVEQRVRVLSINLGNGEQNDGLGKTNNDFRRSQSLRRYRGNKKGSASSVAAAQRNEEAEKATTVKDKKNDDSVTEEVEQRVRVLSIDSGSSKQNGGLGKMNNGFRRFQSQRTYYGNYGHQHSRVQVKKREKTVWVKKDEIGGEIEK